MGKPCWFAAGMISALISRSRWAYLAPEPHAKGHRPSFPQALLSPGVLHLCYSACVHRHTTSPELSSAVCFMQVRTWASFNAFGASTFVESPAADTQRPGDLAGPMSTMCPVLIEDPQPGQRTVVCKDPAVWVILCGYSRNKRPRTLTTELVE